MIEKTKNKPGRKSKGNIRKNITLYLSQEDLEKLEYRASENDYNNINAYFNGIADQVLGRGIRTPSCHACDSPLDNSPVVTYMKVARWMYNQLLKKEGVLYQDFAIRQIEKEFGTSFIEERNEDGGESISENVLYHFRRLCGRHVRWELSPQPKWVYTFTTNPNPLDHSSEESGVSIFDLIDSSGNLVPFEIVSWKTHLLRQEWEAVVALINKVKFGQLNEEKIIKEDKQ